MHHALKLHLENKQAKFSYIQVNFQSLFYFFIGATLYKNAIWNIKTKEPKIQEIY